MKDGHMNIKTLVLSGVFGSLAGFVEISLGSLLHAMKFPLKGTILTCILLFILVLGRKFTEKPGSTLLTGLCAAVLKFMLSLTASKVSPFLSILVVSAAVEAFFTLGGYSLFMAASAGAICSAYPLVHKVAVVLLFSGPDAPRLIEKTVREVTDLLGLTGSGLAAIVAVALVFRAALGVAAAMAGFVFVGSVMKKLGRVVEPAAQAGQQPAVQAGEQPVVQPVVQTGEEPGEKR